MDKAWLASELRSMIGYYTDLTVDEHMSGKINKEADKAWEKIQNLINKLAEVNYG